MVSSLIEETVQAHVERDGPAATYIKVRAQVLMLASKMGEESKNDGQVSAESRAKLKQLSAELPRATAIYRAHLTRVSLLIRAGRDANPDYLSQVETQASALEEEAKAARERALRLEEVCKPCQREMSAVVAAADSIESDKDACSAPYDLAINEHEIIGNLKVAAEHHLPPSLRNLLAQILKDKETDLFKEPLFSKLDGELQLQFMPHQGDPHLANRPIDELELIKASAYRAIAKISAETVHAVNEYSKTAGKLDAMQSALAAYDQPIAVEATADVDMINA